MRALALLFLVLLLPGLAGCATADTGELRLVDTKGSVQLLRNEAWLRLPTLMVKGDEETNDASVACDASGASRSWSASTTALINNSFAPRVEGVATTLVESFVEQGWTATGSPVVLSKEGSLATIEVDTTEKTPEHRASITITTTGPCVATDGPDSDEVRTLEGRK
jgi:hypothetical protein